MEQRLAKIESDVVQIKIDQAVMLRDHKEYRNVMRELTATLQKHNDILNQSKGAYRAALVFASIVAAISSAAGWLFGKVWH